MEKGLEKPDKNPRGSTAPRLALVIVFCTAIAALFVLLIALPKHTGEISPLEFRALADYPFRSDGKVKSANTIAKEVAEGKFSANTDKFLEDHFPARSFFIALNSYTARLTGRNADQGIVMGRNGRMFDAPLQPDSERIKQNVEKLDAFANDNGLKAYYVFVPSAAVTCTDDLPAVHLDYPDDSLIEYARVLSDASVINAGSVFADSGRPGDMMYLTDHHWTMDGAYEVYSKLIRELGREPVPKSGFTEEQYDFRGSFYRQAGLWLAKPDVLRVWRTEALENASVTVGVGAAATEHIGVYDAEKLKEGEVDRYAAYLYSNNAVTVIENPQAQEGCIMMVKDSFGNSIAPLLACNYSRVIMVDTRYYMGVPVMPSELAAEYGAEALVAVFGADSLNSDCQLVFMR